MARYKLILAYDGTDFTGSQRQARARTVQGELEKAMHGLGWTGTSISLAGRTDSGVHATGQVAAFDMDWAHSVGDLLRALNASLPADLAVRDIHEAPAGFHPRFDAASRRYTYDLFCEPVRQPVRERYAWRVWPEVNGDLLGQSAALFAGLHDFSAFGSPTSARGSTQRTILGAKWTNVQAGWRFEVCADAFLYRMVRKLVFVQVAAAHGKCSVEQILNALSGQRELPAGLAPAHGLTLVEVIY